MEEKVLWRRYVALGSMSTVLFKQIDRVHWQLMLIVGGSSLVSLWFAVSGPSRGIFGALLMLPIIVALRGYGGNIMRVRSCRDIAFLENGLVLREEIEHAVGALYAQCRSNEATLRATKRAVRSAYVSLAAVFAVGLVWLIIVTFAVHRAA